MTSIIKVDNIQNSSGTSAMTIDSSGTVSLGNPVYFFGHIEAVANYSSADSVVDFEPQLDTDNGWSTSTNKYTVPFDGVYLVHFAFIRDESVSTDGNIKIMHNSTTVSRAYASAGSGLYPTGSCNAIVAATANDTIYAQTGAANTKVWGNSSEPVGGFTIMRIG